MVWFFGCFLVSIQSTSNIVIGRVQIHCMVRGTDMYGRNPVSPFYWEY